MHRRWNGWAASLVALAVFGLSTGSAQAQARPAIVARAEQCLRQNVDRVVAAERDMQSAASFLVTYACASEVAGASRYQRNAAYVQMFATMFKTMAQAPASSGAKPGPPNPLANMDIKASVDPETGEIITPPAAPGAPANPISNVLPMLSNVFGQVAPDAVPVDLRKLAGDLVLAAHAKAH